MNCVVPQIPEEAEEEEEEEDVDAGELVRCHLPSPLKSEQALLRKKWHAQYLASLY